MSGSPFEFDPHPVEVYSSTEPIEVEIEGTSTAFATSMDTPYDDESKSSPAIIKLNSPDLQQIHQSLRDKVPYAWPYDYQPYMQMNFGSVPHRRHITAFIRSISDTLTRQETGLVFDRFFVRSMNVDVPPFVSYLTGEAYGSDFWS